MIENKEDIKTFLRSVLQSPCGTIGDLRVNDNLLLWCEKENGVDNEVDYCIELLINEDNDKETFSDIVENFNCEEQNLNIEKISNDIMELVELSREEIIERYF